MTSKVATDSPGNRSPEGTYVKGSSGNPSGRPRKVIELVEMARRNCGKAIRKATRLLDDADGRVVMAAAVFLRDTGMGRPSQVEFDLSTVGDDVLRAEIIRRAESRKLVEPRRAEESALNS